MKEKTRTVTFGENESQGIGDVGQLSAADADHLVSDRLRDLAGCDNRYEWFTLSGSKSIRAGCWVGVIQLGRTTIEVLPKVEDGTSVSRIDLNEMLADSLGIKGMSRLSSNSSTGKFIEFFAFDYARRVSALIQRGMPHRYVEQRGLLQTIKGRLDLPMQIQADAAALPYIACTYDAFVADNPLSQFLKAGLVAATRLPVSARTRRMLMSTLAELDVVSDRVVGREELISYTLGKNERDLLPLCNLASLLLRGKSFDTHLAGEGGKKLRGFTLMFNMWEIFENYAVHELNMALKGTPWVARGHDTRLDGKAWYLGAGKLVQLKPDIVIRRRSGDKAIVCVADTKWKKDAGYVTKITKKNTLRTSVTGVQPADAYQALAYTATLSAEEGLALDDPLPVAIIYPKVGKRASSAGLKADKNGNDPLSFLRKIGEPPIRLNAYKKVQGELKGTLSFLYLNCPGTADESAAMQSTPTHQGKA